MICLNKNDVCREVGGNGITFGQYTDAYKYKQSVDADVGPGYDERIFTESDVARFVRLQVREFGDFVTGTDEGLRDSGLGYPGIRKFPNNPPDLNKFPADYVVLSFYKFLIAFFT